MTAIERSNSPRVLLGVTGGIAAYKTPELVRRLVERGCEVQVVMTRGAGQFVSPITFQAVSGRRVRDDLWDQDAEGAMGHIELARWANVVVVAPATAHFIGSLAAGLASDLLGTLCLATTAPVVLVPAMNHVMWAHASVQANRALLESRGVRFLGPAAGDQACGETGPGRMLEPADIASALFDVARLPLRSLAGQPFAGMKVVITAGPTREPIDPVRYITNRSSGKMGFALAVAAREAGADVVLVSGPVALNTPTGVRRIDIETAQQMYDKVHEEIADTDIFIACAAVSDYRPQSVSRQKLKRSAEEIELELVRSPDTLASVAALPQPPFTVGFAAETQDVATQARDKLEKKHLDMIAANQVGPDCGFDRETNSLTVFWRGGELQLGENSK
ncbi:MAG TPA: bifunctional phosphopantothenoylcysteine decarboxylase/phosphopantothenate--cysteine ligase CoaBC, partial [Gammaproteobacteria bacterium]|nr:bifunctional phosphopantothenoylcysteine decarboxylase/phosphopantothenate--cysteine ligase CoaBC [Gammaproteobacteria bacterium]